MNKSIDCDKVTCFNGREAKIHEPKTDKEISHLQVKQLCFKLSCIFIFKQVFKRYRTILEYLYSV